jgi:hypothetical protein
MRLCGDGVTRPIPRALTTEEVEEKFWANVAKENARGCRLWQGPVMKKRNGFVYGAAWNGKNYVRAHRYAFFLTYGDPGRALVCHYCDIPLCCTPDHFFLGNYCDNNQDAVRKKRNAFGVRMSTARLTDAIVLEIRELKRQGWTYVALAQRFLVSPGTIQSAVDRRSWAHVP